jgi:hypothetical protein
MNLPRVPAGTLLLLEPGEWYLDREPAREPTTIRVVAVDRITPRLRGDACEWWVSAHKPSCPDRDTLQHLPCVGGYIPEAAILRNMESAP